MVERAVIKDGAPRSLADVEMVQVSDREEEDAQADWDRDDRSPTQDPPSASSHATQQIPRPIADRTSTAISREGGYQDPKSGKQLRAETRRDQKKRRKSSREAHFVANPLKGPRGPDGGGDGGTDPPGSKGSGKSA